MSGSELIFLVHSGVDCALTKEALNMEPLLLKVNANGLIAWQQSSTTTFQTGYYDKLILKNDFIYLKSSNGLAKFDTTGTEIWSLPIAPQEMTVDDSGRVVERERRGRGACCESGVAAA